MKIDVSPLLFDWKENPVVINGLPMTVGTTLVDSCFQAIRGEQPTGLEAAELYALGQKILDKSKTVTEALDRFIKDGVEAKGEADLMEFGHDPVMVELTIDEAKKLKDRIAKMYNSPYLIGVVFAALEGEEK